VSAASAIRRTAEPPLVEGEFEFTRSDFTTIARELYQRAGISLSDSKANLVYSRLVKRLRALKLGSFAEYCVLIASPEGADELGMMINALTTNVTRFFREPHHFEDLRDRVLAPAVSFLRQGGRMRLWSAACSSGQEPYSMALTVLNLLPEAADLDVKILATDIDSRVLATAREGQYSDEAVEPVPAALRDRWMRRDAGPRPGWRMGPEAQALITFKELNLIGDWPMRGPFDAIFCRNVVIYFDEPTQERVWSRFIPLLKEDGRLYIGHSERVGYGVTGLASDGLTIYRRTGGRRP
jgi:chemotaxis protein methyltransferase CheR